MMGRLRILKSWATTRFRLPFRDRSSLEAWQSRKVEALLRWVLPRSAFYRARMAGLPISGWRQLPTINKQLMMEHFSALNTVGISREDALGVALAAEQSRDFSATIRDITVGLSSGTSGNRGLFLVSRAERERWAGAILAHILPRSLLSPAPDRIAFFLRANSNLYQTVHSRRVQFAFFDLLDPFYEHIVRLNAYAPTILIAPPSVLRILADAARGRALSIHPDRIISVAEVLEPLDERAIEGAFQQPVHQVYQATEGLLGTTCALGTLHLREDVVVVERQPVSSTDSRRFFPIITDFRRTTQPIIRYMLNDILVERAQPCACGAVAVALERVDGRADDIFWARASASMGAQPFVPIFPDTIRQALLRVGGLSSYGVRQVEVGRVALYVEAEAGGDQKARWEEAACGLRALFTRLGAQVPEVSPLDTWPTPGDRKVKRIERQCSAPSASLFP